MGFCYLISYYYRPGRDNGSPSDQMKRNIHLEKKKKNQVRSNPDGTSLHIKLRVITDREDVKST